MCRKHLLGEHVELHMLLGSMKRRKNIQGFISGKLVDPRLMFQRHEQLVHEMEQRGYKHSSPMTESDCEAAIQPYDCTEADIDIKANAEELARRCSECARCAGG